MNPARRPLIVGNWKMFHGGATACFLADEIAKGVGASTAVEVVVAPPLTALAAVAAELDEKPVAVAAQNVNEHNQGAYTGEVSAPMLVESGADWVILGHSERRMLFHETDTLIGAKLEAALAARLHPIVCIGETLAQREGGQTLAVIADQLSAVVPFLATDVGFSAIAYEPIWAIGTGVNARPEQAEEVHAAVRDILAMASPDLARQTRILYGGSVKADNASTLLACPNIDGCLVGGASLDAASFLAIVQAAARLVTPAA